MELTMASNQWANRPADQRYWDIAEMRAAASAEKAASVEKADVSLSACNALAHPRVPGEIIMTGPNGAPVHFSHYSFSQLCAAIQAPAEYLRRLAAAGATDVAVAAINAGLRATSGWKANCLIRRSEGNTRNVLRALTSGSYGRIWNEEVINVAETLVSRGWRVPPARPAGIANERTRRATAADVLRNANHPTLGIREGDEIAPAGLYLSDRDAFVFLIDEEHPIETRNFKGYRGVFFWNSEVGAKTAGFTCFTLDSVCGNHIVWGAKVFADVRMRHTSGAPARWAFALSQLRRSIESPATVETRMIEAAQSTLIAETKDKVIELAYRKADGAFTLSDARESYDIAEKHRDVHGDPRSVWGFTSGITRYSQTKLYAEDRDRLDRAAGKLAVAC